MKKIYLLFALLVSVNSFSQSELIGEWFLQSINYNGVQFDNYLNSNPYILNLTFTQVSENSTSILFDISGSSSCNGFVGEYNIDNTNTIAINNFNALTGSCEGQPQYRYESMYLEIIGDYSTSNNVLTYIVNGTGLNQILTINHPNGDSAVYSKSPTTVSLFRTWYLSSIETNDEVITISSTDSPSLNLTTNTDILSRVELDGIGDCNGFSAFYIIYYNNDNTFLITDFYATLADCYGSSFESFYFSILSDSTTNLFSYEVLNNGQTLILTDLLGEKLIYGSQPLSNSDSVLNELSVSIVENPIKENLQLDFKDLAIDDLTYSIFSIDGKIMINTTRFNDENIKVSQLSSGVYFIKIVSSNNRSKTLRFIKN